MTTTATEARPDLEPGTAASPVEPAAGRARLSVSLDPARTTAHLAAIGFLLVFLHVWVQMLHYLFLTIPWVVRGLLDLDEERSLGTWFAAFLLLAASGTSWVCGSAPATPGAVRRHWRILGAGFLLLSVDEVASLHERINGSMEISWALPGGVLALAFGACSLPFLCRLPRETASLLVLAGALYVGGAAGVELATEPMLNAGRLDTLAYNLSTALEEGLEMAGAIVFLFAVLRHIAR